MWGVVVMGNAQHKTFHRGVRQQEDYLEEWNFEDELPFLLSGSF